jgi:CBS domain-containing protein
MKLRDILAVKGSTVHSIAAEATLQDVVRTLVERNVGSLIIYCEAAAEIQSLAGIITEHDILFACMTGKPPLEQVRVGEVMSSELVTGTPDDEVADVMGLMTNRRIRHLPVLDNGRLVGIISIGDVVKAQHDRLALENRYLKDYITG